MRAAGLPTWKDVADGPMCILVRTEDASAYV